MSNTYEPEVISRLNNSLSKIRANFVQELEDIQEAKRIIIEQATTIFIDNLDIFVKKTLLEKLESNNYTITRDIRYKYKMYIEGNKFSYCIPRTFRYSFLDELADILKTNIKIKKIAEQLFSDTKILLEFSCEKLLLPGGLEMYFIAYFN
jgi:hypothetical protein